ncbi:hypothetical protein PMAYCL1PPCAC_32881, partial [Pristionchus mayeri]
MCPLHGPCSICSNERSQTRTSCCTPKAAAWFIRSYLRRGQSDDEEEKEESLHCVVESTPLTVSCYATLKHDYLYLLLESRLEDLHVLLLLVLQSLARRTQLLLLHCILLLQIPNLLLTLHLVISQCLIHSRLLCFVESTYEVVDVAARGIHHGYSLYMADLVFASLLSSASSAVAYDRCPAHGSTPPLLVRAVPSAGGRASECAEGRTCPSADDDAARI